MSKATIAEAVAALAAVKAEHGDRAGRAYLRIDWDRDRASWRVILGGVIRAASIPSLVGREDPTTTP